MADPELHADLNQGEALGIQAGCILTNRLRQRWRTGFESGPPRDLTDGAAMHLEAGGELPDRHPVGVRSKQVGSIRGTQTGLSLSRILADGATLIGDAGGPRGASTAPRPLDNMGDQGLEWLPGV